MRSRADWIAQVNDGTQMAGALAQEFSEVVELGRKYPIGAFPMSNPRGLRRWRRAFADALNNPPRILVLGDSLVAGIGSDGNNNSSQADATADPYSMPGQLRKMFAGYFGGNEMGFIHAGDSRNTNGGTVVVSNTTGFIGNPTGTSCGALRIASGDSITIPTPVCTDIDIFYYESNGANSTPTTAAWQHNTDAAGNVAVTNGGGNNVLKKTTVSSLAATTHSIVISGTAGTDAYIAGIVYYTSAGPGVVVMRQGLGSATAGDLIGAYTSGTGGAVITTDNIGNTRMKQALTITEADLAIIMCGHNDASNQALAVASTPTNYATHLSTMITTLTNAGACVLLISEPDPPVTNPVAGGHSVRAYWPAMAGLAEDGSHVAYLRIYDLWGDYATANANLLHTQAATTVHCSRMGYGDLARGIFNHLVNSVAPDA